MQPIDMRREHKLSYFNRMRHHIERAARTENYLLSADDLVREYGKMTNWTFQTRFTDAKRAYILHQHPCNLPEGFDITKLKATCLADGGIRITNLTALSGAPISAAPSYTANTWDELESHINFISTTTNARRDITLSPTLPVAEAEQRIANLAEDSVIVTRLSSSLLRVSNYTPEPITEEDLKRNQRLLSPTPKSDVSYYDELMEKTNRSIAEFDARHKKAE